MSKEETRGLKKLKKRVKEGEVVVLPTDKTSKFAIMDRGTYEKAGLSHAVGDNEVGWGDLTNAQKEVNGHISMLIKVFQIGGTWGHRDRVRETMMGESLQVCPIQLLYKDHKNWTKEKGGVPPTRQVAGGHRGLNVHLSEIV